MRWQAQNSALTLDIILELDTAMLKADCFTDGMHNRVRGGQCLELAASSIILKTTMGSF